MLVIFAYVLLGLVVLVGLFYLCGFRIRYYPRKNEPYDSDEEEVLG